MLAADGLPLGAVVHRLVDLSTRPRGLPQVFVLAGLLPRHLVQAVPNVLVTRFLDGGVDVSHPRLQRGDLLWRKSREVNGLERFGRWSLLREAGGRRGREQRG